MSDMFEPFGPDALADAPQDAALVLMSPRRDDEDPEDDGFEEVGGSDELDDEFDDIDDLEDEDDEDDFDDDEDIDEDDDIDDIDEDDEDLDDFGDEESYDDE